MKKDKSITIDQLAIMVQRGFEETASKEDVKSIKADLAELKGKVK